MVAVDRVEFYTDIIDLREAFAEEALELSVIGLDGNIRSIAIQKEIDEDLGLEFEEAVFDNVRECHNNCQFCFVHQMPMGMRKSLYVKDDDYRLSFLYGNFITLTNLTEEDKLRIYQKHLSPLYISVHAIKEDVRINLMKNKYAGNLLNQLEEFKKNNIQFHTQIVLCPEKNDGIVLIDTIKRLLDLCPAILSIAIVPVGLTKYREDLPKLRTFNKCECEKVISSIKCLQDECRENLSSTFIYLADEFYISAGLQIPNEEYYDGFPQLENGIGLSRVFLNEWEDFKLDITNKEKFLIITGTSAFKIIQPLIEEFNSQNCSEHLLYAQENLFFGGDVTVTGLLTSKDICEAIRVNDNFHNIIVPAVCLRKGEDVFLDDVTLEELRAIWVSKNIYIVKDGVELKKILCKGVE